MKRKMIGYIVIGLVISAMLFWGWKLTSRSNYESAEYTVMETDGGFEIRNYADLVLVTTQMGSRVDGGDGSFGKLFRYISGSNDQDQKVAMTTPVFMEPSQDSNSGQMAFVLPKSVAESQIPLPNNEQVQVQPRPGGLFAALRFSGRMDNEVVEERKNELLEWIQSKGLQSDSQWEFASYDPPWTPGPLRRNEVLIRLKD